MKEGNDVFAFQPQQNQKQLVTGQQGNSDESRAIQEVQAAIVIAKRFPRDQIQSMDRVLNACTSPTLAQAALYSYSRGGSAITGPSIRLAEAIAQAWGNISFGIRELSNENGESTVEAFAWDLETNTRQTKVFSVPHERHTRKGVKKLTDPRDIYETVANNGARRLRACILGVIPCNITEESVKRCEETARSSADMTKEGLKKVLDAFDEIGISKSQIEKRIQCRFDAVRPAQIVNLRKIFQSIKDGMSSPGDWFENIDSESISLADLAQGGNQKKVPEKDPAQQAPPEPDQREQPPEQRSGGVNFEGF